MERNERVINAFINCVNMGVYPIDYAVTLIEDSEKFGYLTEEDRERFYLSIKTQDPEE